MMKKHKVMDKAAMKTIGHQSNRPTLPTERCATHRENVINPYCPYYPYCPVHKEVVCGTCIALNHESFNLNMASAFVGESVVEFTFPSKFYPRFQYFQKQYESFLPELQMVEDYAFLYNVKTPEYKSLSDRKYDQIHVTVVDIGSCSVDYLARELVKVQEDDDKQVATELYLDKMSSAKELNIKVFTKTNKEDWTTVYPLIELEKGSKNVAFHDAGSNASSTYEDMVKNGYTFKYDKYNKTSTLGSTIQHILEYNVVSVMCEIVKFISHIEEWSDKLQAKGEDFSKISHLDNMPNHEKEKYQDEKQDLEQSLEMKKQPTEEDVNELKETMTILKDEIFGLLEQTKIDPICISIPKYPKLSSELQMDLLRIPEIVGCGTMYGKLVMHISRKAHAEGPSDAIKNMVKQLLEKHNYSDGYSIELMGEIRESSHIFKQGDETKVSSTQIGTEGFGTLGCFVNVKNGNTNNNELFGITCAHCILNYGTNVTINSSDEREIAGTSSHAVYWKDRVDIAAIEIAEKYNELCDKSFIIDGKRCENWTFQEDGDLKRSLKVYKSGSVTGFTQGNIISTNYLIDQSPTVDDYKQVRSIVIKRSKKTTSGWFATQGDSGSVVWYEHLGNLPGHVPVVRVIGIIFAITPGRKGLTFCCPIYRSIQELERQFGQNFKIEPARQEDKTQDSKKDAILHRRL